MNKNSFHILIVEDDPSDFELTEIELNKIDLDITIHSATSQKEFESFLDEQLPDIIICDYQLPGYNGRKALEKTRSIHPYLPFILLTGFLGENEAIDLMRNGASDIVMKDRIQRIGPAAQRELINFRERVRTQNEIEKANKRFQALVEHGGDVVVIIDKNGVPGYTTPSVKDIFGYTIKEALGLNLNEVVHPKDLKQVNEILAMALAHPGKSLSVPSIRIKNKDGSWRWCEATLTNLKTEPSVNGIVCNIRDIDEQVKNARIINLMLNNTEDSFIFIDKDLIIQNFNDLFAQNYKAILGVAVKEGNSILDYAQPERKEIVKEIYERVFEGETVENLFPIKNKEGYTRYFHIKYKPARNEKGEIIGSFVSLLEKTQEEHAKLALEKNEARFRALVENGSDILFILDENGNPTYASPSIEHVLGYTPEEVIQKDMFNAVHPDDIEMMAAEIQKCLKKPGVPIEVPPARLRDKEGNWHWFDGTITNMLHDPAIGGIVDNFREITERLEAEQKIVRAKEQYQSLVQTIEGVIWESDPEGVLINYLSPQSKHILGYDPEKWVNTPDFWESRIHPDDQKQTLEKHHSEINAGNNHELEYRFRKADGSYIWIRDLISIVGQNGSMEKIRGLMMDITQEKELELKLEQAYKMASIGTWELDLENDALFWSDYVKQLHDVELDFEPELETAINFYKDGWSREKIAEAVNKTIKDGTPFDLELIIVTAKGTEKWIRTVGKADVNDGVTKRIYGSTQDITNRKKAEVELRKSNLLLAERVKEQRCLYEITNLEEQDLTIEELLSQAVTLIPSGMQYADIAEAKITWKKQKFETQNFGRSSIKLAESNHRFGENALQVEIQYTDTKREYGNEPFLEEEKDLLKAITNQLAQKIDQIIKRDEIREAEEKYRNVVEHSTNMFYQHDTEGVLSYVSPQSIKFLGRTPEEAKRNWMDYITDHPLNKAGEKLTLKALETGETQQPYELQLKSADGREIWVEVHEAPLKKNGKVVGIVGSLSDVTDRKKYEEELRKSIERYDYVTKATRDAIYDWDIEEDQIHWGEGLSTLFSHRAEKEFPLSKWAELVHPDDIKETKRDLEFTLNDHSMDHWIHEYRFIKGNNSYAHVLENGYIIRDEDGKAIRMIGALRDVTERKQAEIQTALQQQVAQFFKNDNRLSPILDNLLHFLADYQKFNLAEIWLLSGNQTHLNLISKYARDKTGEKFYQNSKDIQKLALGKGLVGIAWSKNQVEICDKIDTSKKFMRNKAAKESGMKSACALPLYHNELPVGILLLASKDSASEIKHKIQNYEAIQDFLGAEIRRKQQEEEMMLLFESSPDILALTAPDNHFVKVNPAFCEILGYTEEELTSQNFEYFIHPDDLKNTLKEYEENITGERQANNYINRWRTKSGEYRWISWSSSDIFGEDGYFFAFGRDVTDRTELEHLLNQAQKIAKIGGWEVDLINNKVYWSPITKEIHEVEPDFEPDLETGINFYKEGESREKIRKAVQLAIDEGKSWDEELQIITARNNEKWIRAKGEPEIVDGKCVRIIGSFQDINEKKVLENLLKQTNRLAKVGSWELEISQDGDDTMFWSEMTREIMEVPEDYNPTLTRGFEFYEEDSKKEIQAATEKAISKGEPYDTELKLTNYKGNIRWVRCIGDADFVNGTCKRLYGSFQDITTRKQAEIQLEETLKEKDTILESIGDAFFALDKDWKVTYWNKEAEKVLHKTRDEIIGKNLWDEYEDATELEFYKQYHKAVNEQVSVNFQEYYPAVEKWFEVSAYPSENGLSVYFKDITERKIAEIELERAYKEKETILESIDDGFFTLDESWTVTYWNKQAERLLHTPKQEIVGNNLWDVFDDAVDLPSYTNYHRVMHKRVTVNFEDYYAPIGKWFDINAYPAADGISVFFKDITDRKLQDENIKRINERFEKVTEATNDAIWDFNVSENHLFWGRGFETLFGYDLDKINPNFEFLASLIHPDDRERVAEKIQEYMSDPEKTSWYEEYRFKKANGDFAYVIDRANFIHNSKGDVIRVVGAMTDLTSQKKAEEVLRRLNEDLEEQTKQLEISNAELEQFAYVASHDLQEPLRMVTSFLTQLEKKYGDKLDDKAREYIHFAVDGSKRMRQIILDLLNYSRLNQDKTNREKIDLNKILKDVQSLERSRIEEKKAVIKIQKLPAIVANLGPIKQVFQNLLSNALKYQKPGKTPEIEITAKELDAHWEFSMKDNGIGINPEFQDTIFQIFQRLHTKDEYAGTGIGLAITKKIIERHGGEIWVDSEEGKGSTFYFTLAKSENE